MLEGPQENMEVQKCVYGNRQSENGKVFMVSQKKKRNAKFVKKFNVALVYFVGK